MPNDIIDYLLADVELHQFTDGRSFFHLSSEQGNTNLLRYLQERGAAIDELDAAGDTPLIIAVRNRQLPSVKFLLKAKASLDETDEQGLTALDIAREQKSFALGIRALENAGARSQAELGDNGENEAPAKQAIKFIDDGEVWGSALKHKLSSVEDDSGAIWFTLIRTFSVSDASKPSKNGWLLADPLIEGIGEAEFRTWMLDILPLMKKKSRTGQSGNEEEEAYSHFTSSDPEFISHNNTRLL